MQPQLHSPPLALADATGSDEAGDHVDDKVPVDRGLRITTHHRGRVARMQVGGELTEIGHQHVAALLHTMIAAGCARIVVHLAGADMVSSGLLQVLRAARTRLGGRLTVIADRAEPSYWDHPASEVIRATVRA